MRCLLDRTVADCCWNFDITRSGQAAENSTPSIDVMMSIRKAQPLSGKLFPAELRSCSLRPCRAAPKVSIARMTRPAFSASGRTQTYKSLRRAHMTMRREGMSADNQVFNVVGVERG